MDNHFNSAVFCPFCFAHFTALGKLGTVLRHTLVCGRRIYITAKQAVFSVRFYPAVSFAYQFCGAKRLFTDIYFKALQAGQRIHNAGYQTLFFYGGVCHFSPSCGRHCVCDSVFRYNKLGFEKQFILLCNRANRCVSALACDFVYERAPCGVFANGGTCFHTDTLG